MEVNPDDMLFVPEAPDTAGAERITAAGYSYGKSVLRAFCRKRRNPLLLLLLVAVLAFAWLYPVLSGYDPEADPFVHLLDPAAKHLGPKEAMERFGYSLRWCLGTGASGQSTFDAVWYGAGISVSLAFLCGGINLTVGVLVGTLWGFSRRVDAVMTEVYNIISNIPYILLICVVVLIMTPGFFSLVFALTVTGWVGIAYFIRTQVILLRDREYNLASRCLGTPWYRIALKNVLPALLPVIVTLAATEIPTYLSYEVFLSFIGLGLEDLSLGRLIEASQNAMLTPGWELEFWSPVAVAAVIALTLYLTGQSLGDATDPRTHT